MNKLPVSYGVLLFATVAVVVTVTAYDFEDPEFNQFLASDLEDVYSFSYSHPRLRREDKSDEEDKEDKDKCRPHKRRGKLCCAEEAMDKIMENRDLKRACFKEITGKDKPERPDKHHGPDFDPFSCEKVEQHRKEMMCISQCVGEKQNLVDAEGNPNLKEYTKFISESFSILPYLDSLQEKVITTCMAEAKNATAKNTNSKDGLCSPSAMILSHCAFRQVQMNCPTDQIKDPKLCARFQERMNKDKNMPPPPPTSSEVEDN